MRPGTGGVRGRSKVRRGGRESRTYRVKRIPRSMSVFSLVSRLPLPSLLLLLSLSLNTYAARSLRGYDALTNAPFLFHLLCYVCSVRSEDFRLKTHGGYVVSLSLSLYLPLLFFLLFFPAISPSIATGTDARTPSSSAYVLYTSSSLESPFARRRLSAPFVDSAGSGNRFLRCAKRRC